jgi:hypothetical protein
MGDIFAQQLRSNDFAASADVRGSGQVRIPAALLQEVQTNLAAEYWTSSHPFLVLQLACIHPITELPDTTFVVVHLDAEPSAPSTIWLSPAILQRTKWTRNITVFSRFVMLSPVRPSSRGVGVVLGLRPVRQQSHASVDESRLRDNLIKELEKQYILVKNQWVSVQDENKQWWVYHVKQLFDVDVPVDVISIYNAQLAVQLEFPSQEDIDKAPLTLEEMFTTWNQSV